MNKLFLKKLLYGFSAQAIALLSSFIMSLIVPKMLGVEEYAYWQLFIFYSGYVGVFHFGLIDGIYLRLGGADYDSIDFPAMGSQLKTMVFYQTLIGIVFIIAASFISNDSSRISIAIAVAAYMVIANTSTFINYTFQAANETEKNSISTMIDKVGFILLILILLLAKIKNFETYVIFYLLSKTISLIYSVIVGRKIIFSKLIPITPTLKEMYTNISVGINLMLSSLSSMLILGSGRFIIDRQWGIEAFGKFSFSISISNLFLVFMSQVSMVLFPTLRRVGDAQINKGYKVLTSILNIFMPLSFVFYSPIKNMLGYWLPEYQESLQYMALLLPLCLINGNTELVCSTYFKVLRKERFLLKVNSASMLLSIALSLIGAYVFNNISLMAVFIVMAFGFRNIACEVYLARLMNSPIAAALIQKVLLIVIFMLSAYFLDSITSFVLILTVYIVYLLFNKATVVDCLKFIINIKNI